MQIKNYLKILVFIFTLGMALSAWGDYTVPANRIVQNVDKELTFDFGTIKYTNWQELSNYKEQKLYSGATTTTYSHAFPKKFGKQYILSSEMASYLIIDTDPMPDYIANQYYSNATNLGNRNYTIFKVDNSNEHIGFIITTSDGTNASTPIDIKKGENVIYPTQGVSSQNIVLEGKSITYKAATINQLDAQLFITLVVIPANDMKAGETSINRSIGKFEFYDATFNPLSIPDAIIDTYKLTIRGKIIMDLPSCTINNQSINLGTVTKNQILAGNLPEKDTNLTLSCPNTINHIYARVYDVNDTSNTNTDGKLSLKCASGSEAGGVKVEVKVNDNLAKFGEKSFLRPINLKDGKEYTNFLTKDSTLIDFGNNNTGSTNIKISGKYVQDGTQQITPGCANAKMGIIFNYQ